MKIKQIISHIILFILLIFSCQKETTNPSLTEISISGQVIDKASGLGLSGTVVKISNNESAYCTTTGTNGYFGFQDIKPGEYMMITETVLDNHLLKDTCGTYNTNVPDWGTIFTEHFAAIRGTVSLKGVEDYEEQDK